MAPPPESPLAALAAYGRRLGLRLNPQPDGSLQVLPDWPTEAALRIEAADATEWPSAHTLRWDGTRCTADTPAAPHPAAALILAHHLESLRRTGLPPASASSPTDLALDFLDLGSCFSDVFDTVLLFLSNVIEKKKKNTDSYLADDTQAHASRAAEALQHGLAADGVALVGWLVAAGFFRRSRADQREILDRIGAARRAEASPPALEAWIDAAWLLAQTLTHGRPVALNSPQPDLWHDRHACLHLDLQLAGDPAAAAFHILDQRTATEPVPWSQLTVPPAGGLLALMPRRWWAAPGYHRWRQQLARHFDLELALEDPEVMFRLAVLRPRAADAGAPPLLVRFHRPLAELLPPDGSAAGRRIDRLQALLETARLPPAETAPRYRFDDLELGEELRPSLRVRRLATQAHPTAWALAQALPGWWLALVAPGEWLPAEGRIDFRSRNLRGWAAAWALGPRWPAEPDLHRAEAAPRTVAGWLVAREARWGPWLESGLFWRLCRLAQHEGLPWTSVVRLPPELAPLPEGHDGARDGAIVQALAGGAATELLARLAEEEGGAGSPTRSDPAYEAFARACRPLLPPRPLTEALYRPRSRRDPPAYASLDLLRLPRPAGPLHWDCFLGQYGWYDGQGRELWRGGSWAQGAWLGIQRLGEGPLTCPREEALAAELVERYRHLREGLRRVLRRAAFARGISPTLATQWAERLLSSQFGPLVPPSFWHTD